MTIIQRIIEQAPTTRSFIVVVLSISALAHAGGLDPAKVARGKAVFQTNCIVCHGEKGDGKGIAAAAIQGKKPRDFTKGKFQYGSSDEALFKTITDGVAGTAMPPWVALPKDDREAVVQYIRTLKK